MMSHTAEGGTPQVSGQLASWMRNRVALAVAALLVLAINIPVIAWSEWIPLDVPMLFHMCNVEQRNWGVLFNPYLGTGRLYPVYLGWHCIQYQLFGASVAPYFLVQCLMLLGVAAMLCLMFRDPTRNRWLTALLLVALYLNIPLAEAFSALGKNEPTAGLLMIAIVFFFYRTRLDGPGRAWKFAATALLFTAAIWGKESSVVLLVFPVAGVFLSTVLGRVPALGAATLHRAAYLRLLAALVIGALLARVPYLVFQDHVKSATYTQYAITPDMVAGNISFYLQQQPDVVFFGVLAIVLLALALRLLVRSGRAVPAAETDQLVLMASLAGLAWAHWAGFQLWRWPHNYLMLLAAFLFKLCAFSGAVMLHRAGGLPRGGRGVLATGTVLALLWAAIGSFYIASSHVAYSRVYTDAIQQVAKVATRDSRVVFEPYVAWAEHVSATELLLNNQLHLPIKTAGVGQFLDPAPVQPETLRMLNMTPAQFTANAQAPLKNGDLLLTFTGSKLGEWALRGVMPYYRLGSVFENDDRYELKKIAEKEIRTPALYLRTGSGQPDADIGFLGYKLYSVAEKKPGVRWTSGHTQDGWAEERSTLVIPPAYSQPVVLMVRMLPYNLPTNIRVTVDGKPFREINVTDTVPITLDLGQGSTAARSFEFEVSRSFVPRDLGLNEDPRRLAAHITLAPPEQRP